MKAKVLTAGLDVTLVETALPFCAAAMSPSPAHRQRHSKSSEKSITTFYWSCYSTPHEEATALIQNTRKEFPSLPIVRLLSHDSPQIEKPVADKLVTIDYRPQLWMKAVDELLTHSGQSPCCGPTKGPA